MKRPNFKNEEYKGDQKYQHLEFSSQFQIVKSEQSFGNQAVS